MFSDIRIRKLRIEFFLMITVRFHCENIMYVHVTE